VYLIDTNIISELPKKLADPGVLAFIARQQTLVVSAITLDELAFGIARLRKDQGDRLRHWYETFLAIPPAVVPVDQQVAEMAGRLRASRERAGQIASQADMLIAASAIATGRVLVTRNARRFLECGVSLLNPFAS
jgi:predicted nucleic acid-binding protein